MKIRGWFLLVLLLSSVVVADEGRSRYAAANSHMRAAQSLQLINKPWEAAYAKSRAEKRKAILCLILLGVHGVAILLCLKKELLQIFALVAVPPKGRLGVVGTRNGRE